MFGWAAGWKGIALLAVACLVAGFTTGWRVKTWQIESEQVSVEKQVMKEDAANQADAAARDAEIGKSVDTIEASTQSAQQEIQNALPPTPKPRKVVARKPVTQVAHANAPIVESGPSLNEPSAILADAVGSARDCDVPALPVGVVGVLNRQLDPAAPDPAGWSDEEKRAPSDVGLRELSLKLNEVAGQYHDLATRHDALVDWVDAEVKKSQESRE